MLLTNFWKLINKRSEPTTRLLFNSKRLKDSKPVASMSKPIEINVQSEKLLKLTKTIIPKLTNDKHKGQYGRIGVIGGSLEYTGAPYFAAISALKLGADLAHVFCQKDAAVVIKSYSPELIVHPLLDDECAAEKIESWLERLHVIVIGPGLGRDNEVQKTVIRLITMCLNNGKPLVIDADGLALLQDNFELICGKRNIILTPNAIEFKRLFGNSTAEVRQRMSALGDGVVVLEKGTNDLIHIPNTNEIYILPTGGSGRRCGGQGDLLSGTLAAFYNWAIQSNQPNPAFLSAFAASYLIKKCNAAAFKVHGRSMLASDMINQISNVFQTTFESN